MPRELALAGRGLGLAVLAVLAWKVLTRPMGVGDAGSLLGFFHGVDLIFHEAGHVIFGLFGQFPGVLGGSLMQVLVPTVCAGSFLWRGQYASASAPLFWTGESLTDLAIYVADGRAMRLPLLADGLIHDWNWLLGRLGLLQQAEALGRFTFALGALTVLAALAMLALDCWRCWLTPASDAM